MTSTGESARRAVPEAEQRTTLRLRLMDRYRAEPRYRARLRQDLVPLWRGTAAAPGWPDDFPIEDASFMDVVRELEVLEERIPEPAAAGHARRYVRDMVRTVARTMGLVDEGRPATWALQVVHDDVAGRARRSRLLAISPRDDDEVLSLSLDLTPNYVGVRYFPAARDAAALPDQEFDLSTLGVGYGPDHWAALEHTACGVIHIAIGVMREDVERRHPLRNPTHIARWEADLDLLHRALFHGDRPLLPAESARLRRLAKILGIDPPARDRAQRPLPAWPEDRILGDSALR